MIRNKINNIQDAEIQQMISELLLLLGRSETAFPDYTIQDFLQALMTHEVHYVSSQVDLLKPPILSTKLEKLQRHASYALCKSLNNEESLEPFDRLTLLAFLKKHFAKQCPKPSKPRRGISKQEQDTRLAIQRRKNAS